MTHKEFIQTAHRYKRLTEACALVVDVDKDLAKSIGARAIETFNAAQEGYETVEAEAMARGADVPADVRRKYFEMGLAMLDFQGRCGSILRAPKPVRAPGLN